MGAAAAGVAGPGVHGLVREPDPEKTAKLPPRFGFEPVGELVAQLAYEIGVLG